jgi:hypothetical protein
MRLVLVIGLLTVPLTADVPQTVPLTAGMTIDHSMRIRPGTYRLLSSALDRPAITIRGSDVVVTMDRGDH